MLNRFRFCYTLSNMKKLGTTTNRQKRVPRGYRLSQDIASKLRELAARHSLSEAKIVEIYLGAALGLREFPPAIRPLAPQPAENSLPGVDFV